jgi:hypothetical protein
VTEAERRETINMASKRTVRLRRDGQGQTAFQAFSRIDRKYAPKMPDPAVYMETGKGPGHLHLPRADRPGQDKQPDGGKRICSGSTASSTRC